jgi:hypothetical protein
VSRPRGSTGDLGSWHRLFPLLHSGQRRGSLRHGVAFRIGIRRSERSCSLLRLFHANSAPSPTASQSRRTDSSGANRGKAARQFFPTHKNPPSATARSFASKPKKGVIDGSRVGSVSARWNCQEAMIDIVHVSVVSRNRHEVVDAGRPS